MSTDASARWMDTTTGEHAVVVSPPAPALSGNLLRRQIVQYAPGVLLPAVISVVSAYVFTRVFDANAYGRFSLALSVASVVVLLLSQWLQQGVARFVPAVAAGEPTESLKAGIALALLLIQAITLAVGTLAIGLSALLLAPPWPRYVVAGVALAMATTMFGPMGAMIQSEMRARRYSAYVVVTSVLRLLLALGLVLLVSRDPASLLWAQAGSLAVALPLLWRDVRFPPLHVVTSRWREWWPRVRAMAAYGYPVVGFTIAGTLLDLSDRWVIQYFRGATEVGVYAANYSLVFGTVGLVALPMLLATHPFLMRAWESGDRAAAGRWLGSIVEWYIVAGTLVVGVVGLYSRDIATVMLGPSFREGYRIIPIVLGGMITWQLGMYSHKPLEFTERTGVMFQLCLAATAVNLVANLFVVPRFGYMGAAWTSLASYVLYTIVATHIGQRILPWRVQWSRVAGALTITVLGLALAGGARVPLEARFGYLAGLALSALLSLATVATVLAREIVPLLRATRRPAAT